MALFNSPRRARRALAVLFASVTLVIAMAVPAAAVTNGALDGDAHPYVVLLVAQDAEGTPLWRCTGTLMSPTIVLTAGHCTEEPAAHIEVWFDADVTDATAHDYPFTGDVGGTPYTHPQYDPDAFFLFDLGVVELDTPFESPNGVYGVLPTLNQLDSMKPGRRSLFTSVGYGLQAAFPDAAAWKDQQLRIRMVAHPQLLQVNTPGFTGDYSLLLSNNAHTGGTCFGDSGGPNFIGNTNVVAGVTSFGINPTCGGTGGVYRIDRADDLAWLATFGLGS